MNHEAPPAPASPSPDQLAVDRSAILDAFARLSPCLATLTPPPPEVPPAELAEWMRLAQSARSAGQVAEAKAAFARIVAANPTSFIAHRNLADLHFQEGDLGQSLSHHFQALTSVPGKFVSPDYLQVSQAISPFSLLSGQRLHSLYCHTRQICLDDIPGNFVECGTYKGGAAALMAFAIKQYSSRPRKLFCFDTFEGMPPAGADDIHRGVHADSTHLGSGTLPAPIEQNLAILCQALSITDIVEPVKGLFADTLRPNKARIGPVALLHADADWYSSTIEIFETFYDALVPDAIVQIDDYGFWEGCRKAVHELESRFQTFFPLRNIDDTGAWFRHEVPRPSAAEHWRVCWNAAVLADAAGDRVTALSAVHAVLKLVPDLIPAHALLARLEPPAPAEGAIRVLDTQPNGAVVISFNPS